MNFRNYFEEPRLDSDTLCNDTRDFFFSRRITLATWIIPRRLDERTFSVRYLRAKIQQGWERDEKTTCLGSRPFFTPAYSLFSQRLPPYDNRRRRRSRLHRIVVRRRTVISSICRGFREAPQVQMLSNPAKTRRRVSRKPTRHGSADTCKPKKSGSAVQIGSHRIPDLHSDAV